MKQKTVSCFFRNLFLACMFFICTNAAAQTGTFSLINLNNHYTNEITNGLYQANYRSGMILQTTGSINFGLKGHLPYLFMFRWLAKQDADIDYTGDQDQLMTLDGFGHLEVKNRVKAADLVATGSIDYSSIYTNRIRPVVYTANFRSGTAMESNGSINFGMTGPKEVGFRFRWLAKDNSAINYAGDEDVLMSLDPHGLLQLKGNMHAKRIKVTQEIWPDYVFEPEYRLPPLTEVASYIQENKHLPGVPSAKEVATNGLDLGQTQSTLLQKIEELTLYLIEQHKSSKAQQELITKQQLMLEEQQRRIEALEKRK